MIRNFRPLSPFGVEATGAKLAEFDAADAEALRSALAVHGVAILRDRDATDADFVNFLQSLGPLAFTAGEVPVAGQPELNLVTNVNRRRPPRSVFHTDTSYVACPPAYTALRVVVPPESGGETLFSNQYLARATLPPAIARQLADRSVLHAVTGLPTDTLSETQCWHPLFRKHPLSGRVALFLSTPERCQALSGFDPATSTRAIRLLYAHSTRSRRLYRHRWQPGDIAIWDNRCTMHRADHSQVVGDRVFHRGLVAGEAPLAASEAALANRYA